MGAPANCDYFFGVQQKMYPQIPDFHSRTTAIPIFSKIQPRTPDFATLVISLLSKRSNESLVYADRVRFYNLLGRTKKTVRIRLPFRILIADDHAAMRGVLRALIESHVDWQVCGEAGDGFEAVAKAEELKPDLVILDLAMPIMDGVRAAREISNAAPDMPILMHTMYGSSIVELEAKKAGVSMVVNKGENGGKLLTVIEDLLTAKQRDPVSEANASLLNIASATPTTPATEPSDEPSIATGDIATEDGKDEPKPN
jgi:DNA-binding NarL/FixJ family response regulator